MSEVFEVSPALRARLLGKDRHDPDAYISQMGIRITGLEAGWAEGEMTVTRKNLNPWGNVHGGALAGFADTVAGTAASADGRGVVTVNCAVQYLRPANGPTLTCRAQAQKLGRTLRVFTAEIRDAGGQTVATGTFTFFALDRGPVLDPSKEA